MAKRIVEPLVGTRNIFTVVPVPKSKMRAQVARLLTFTQAVMLKSDRPFTMPVGILTNCVPPAILTACPFTPVTNVGPLLSVAFLPLPLLSLAFPSNLYQTTRPGTGVAVGPPGVLVGGWNVGSGVG